MHHHSLQSDGPSKFEASMCLQQIPVEVVQVVHLQLEMHKHSQDTQH